MKSEWKEYNTQYPLVRHRKVEKAIMFAVNRAKYFLCADVSTDLESTASELKGNMLRIYSKAQHELYFKLFELDALIRTTDDLIDEDLGTRTVYPKTEIEKAISDFQLQLPSGKRVVHLFHNEVRLREAANDTEKVELLLGIMVDRSSDIDLLAETISSMLGTSLTDSEYKLSLQLLLNWEFYESIITDLWYSRQDAAKDSFNIFNYMKTYSLNYNAIDTRINGAFDAFSKTLKKLPNHSYLRFLQTALNKNQELYTVIYKPLITKFFENEEEFYQDLLAIKLI